jgi:hypothetical protein
MVKVMGAPIAGDEQQSILRYLNAHYGK